MARIAGVDLPREKRVEIGLTYIYGIGLHTSQKLLERTGINPDTRVRDLTDDEVNRLRDIIDKEMRVEGDLRREVSMNIKRLMDIGCYRGLRHRRGMPVRGQRTRTNARTRRGPKRAIGVGNARRSNERSERRALGSAWRLSARRVVEDNDGTMAERRRGAGPGKGKTRIRRRDRKNIPRGRAYIQATFNNTIVTLTDPAGNVHLLVERRRERLQGLAQEHAVRRAGDGRAGRPPRDGARSAPGRCLRAGAGFRPRDGDPRAAVARVSR